MGMFIYKTGDFPPSEQDIMTMLRRIMNLLPYFTNILFLVFVH